MNNVRPLFVMCHTESSLKHQTPFLVSATSPPKVSILPAFSALHRKEQNMYIMSVMALFLQLEGHFYFLGKQCEFLKISSFMPQRLCLKKYCNKFVKITPNTRIHFTDLLGDGWCL
jgi:hypothetical protein